MKNGRAKQKAYKKIKGLILRAQLKPGQAVTETALSRDLRLSRTPIREALHELEREGLIITKNRRKRVYMLTVHEIEDIFDLKIEIESAVAGWAARRGSKTQFRQLNNISNQMQRLARRRPGNEKKRTSVAEQMARRRPQIACVIISDGSKQARPSDHSEFQLAMAPDETGHARTGRPHRKVRRRAREDRAASMRPTARAGTEADANTFAESQKRARENHETCTLSEPVKKIDY